MHIKSIVIFLCLICLAGTAAAMGSTNYDLSWNVIGGGGGSGSSASYTSTGTVGQIAGVSASTNYQLQGGFWVTGGEGGCGFTVVPLSGFSAVPTDPDGDCLYEDLNVNGELDFNDVIVYFNQMEWIEVNEPVAAFDYNSNGEIDFNDVIRLFNEI